MQKTRKSPFGKTVKKVKGKIAITNYPLKEGNYTVKHKHLFFHKTSLHTHVEKHGKRNTSRNYISVQTCEHTFIKRWYPYINQPLKRYYPRINTRNSNSGFYK